MARVEAVLELVSVSKEGRVYLYTQARVPTPVFRIVLLWFGRGMISHVNRILEHLPIQSADSTWFFG